jgi:hypothetical protein
MANTLTAYTPEFWSALNVDILREKIVLPNLVRRDWSPELAEAGDTVNTRRPAKMTTNDFTYNGQITVQNLSAANVPITLNQHKEVTFEVTDREASRSFKNIVDEFMDPAMLALANDVDTAIASLYTDIAGASASTTLTAASAAAWDATIQSARTTLNRNLVPTGDRYLVLSDDDEGALLSIDKFVKVNESGDGGRALRNGEIGRLYGFDIFRASNIVQVGSPLVRKNLAFHRDAFAMVMRPLATALGQTPGAVQTVGSDSDAGLSLRFTRSYSHTYLKTVVTFDILYGLKTIEAATSIDDVDSALIINASG